MYRGKLIFVPGTEVEFVANICDDAVIMSRKFIIVPGTKKDTMQYKNPHHKKRKNTHALGSPAASVKTCRNISESRQRQSDQDAGLTRRRSEVDLENLEGHFSCPVWARACPQRQARE